MVEGVFDVVVDGLCSRGDSGGGEGAGGARLGGVLRVSDEVWRDGDRANVSRVREDKSCARGPLDPEVEGVIFETKGGKV